MGPWWLWKTQNNRVDEAFYPAWTCSKRRNCFILLQKFDSAGGQLHHDRLDAAVGNSSGHISLAIQGERHVQ
jgi:hypothetical protein